MTAEKHEVSEAKYLEIDKNAMEEYETYESKRAKARGSKFQLSKNHFQLKKLIRRRENELENLLKIHEQSKKAGWKKQSVFPGILEARRRSSMAREAASRMPKTRMI